MPTSPLDPTSKFHVHVIGRQDTSVFLLAGLILAFVFQSVAGASTASASSTSIKEISESVELRPISQVYFVPTSMGQTHAHARHDPDAATSGIHLDSPAVDKGIPGVTKPYTLLILVQNNHELRPTGGFITAVGRVTIHRGEIVEMELVDSYAVFRNDAIASYPTAPQPMQEYMEIPYLTFRDANWSPNFRTTALIARNLYELDTGKSFDDIITVDLNAVQKVIEALGPLTIDGLDDIVTGENVLDTIEHLWAAPPGTQASLGTDVQAWWRDRKDFIPKLAQSAIAKIRSGDVCTTRFLSERSCGILGAKERDP